MAAKKTNTTYSGKGYTSTNARKKRRKGIKIDCGREESIQWLNPNTPKAWQQGKNFYYIQIRKTIFTIWIVYKKMAMLLKVCPSYELSFFFFFFFFFFCLFASFLGPLRTAYGGSQARGLIGAIAAGLCQSHSNVGSESHLQPTPQLTATLDR